MSETRDRIVAILREETLVNVSESLAMADRIVAIQEESGEPVLDGIEPMIAKPDDPLQAQFAHGYNNAIKDVRDALRTRPATQMVPTPPPVLRSPIVAALNADWEQVVGNGGPPCFHVEGERFCLRAKRWGGHNEQHTFISLAHLLAAIQEESGEPVVFDMCDDCPAPSHCVELASCYHTRPAPPSAWDVFEHYTGADGEPFTLQWDRPVRDPEDVDGIPCRPCTLVPLYRHPTPPSGERIEGWAKYDGFEVRFRVPNPDDHYMVDGPATLIIHAEEETDVPDL